MAEKKVLWLTGEENEEGRYEGAYFEAEGVYNAVNVYDYPARVWPQVSGTIAETLTIPAEIEWEGEKYDRIRDMDYNDSGKYLDSLVGAEGKYIVDEMYGPATDMLAYSYDENEFSALDGWMTVKCYDYICDSNLKTITLDTDNSYGYNEEIEVEVLSTYTLDIWDGSNHYYPKRSTGNHAVLEKVLADGEPALLWHEWSQWQGSELDAGCIMTVEEALERLCPVDGFGEINPHPELDEIKEWLNK